MVPNARRLKHLYKSQIKQEAYVRFLLSKPINLLSIS